MLFAAALIFAQKSNAETFSNFVEESAVAVRTMRPGLWTSKTIQGKSVQTQILVVDGRRMKAHIELDGKPAVDFANTPTSEVLINYTARTFSQATFSEGPEEGPEPLPPLAADEFDFKLMSNRGLVLRTGTPPDTVEVSLKKGVETLDASLTREGGKKSTFRLTRDAKTKLPIHFYVKSAKTGDTLDIDFKFERRKPTEAELTIAPEAHAGFKEVPFSSGG